LIAKLEQSYIDVCLFDGV